MASPLDRRKLLALGLAASGLILALGPGAGRAAGIGVALALGSACAYSAYIIALRRFVRDIPPIAAAAVILPSACVVFGLYGVLTGTLDLALSPRAYLAIGGIAVISTVFASTMFFAGLALVGASRAAILSTFEPVVTLTLGAALLGERLTATQWAGGACIVGAVFLLYRTSAAATARRP